MTAAWPGLGALHLAVPPNPSFAIPTSNWGAGTPTLAEMGWLTLIARDERAILSGLAISAVGLVLMMRSILKTYRDDAEVKPAQPKTQYITQETEDALKLNTLDTLLGHYNYAIRETAGKIVCDRAINDVATVEVLLYGITRPDYDERMKNLRCLAIITDHRALRLVQ